MHLLINGLSARALSGWYVLRGHLSQLANAVAPHRVSLLIDQTQRERLEPIPATIFVIEIPLDLSRVMARIRWERGEIHRIVRRERIDAVLNMSGGITGGLPVPEATVALNPWCMVHDIPKTFAERCKAAVQRWGYRRAMKHADRIFFCSTHLMRLYQANARGIKHCPLELLQIGLEPEIYEAAERLKATVAKVPGLIVSVSAMAPWKGADRLVRAMRIVVDRVPHARLKLVGPWPNRDYETSVRELIQQLRLTDAVEITGPVTREELYRHYAEASVYALLSRAESFGIPALEAQAFGCPVLGATDCAMPEVGGDGGRYVDAYAVEEAAKELVEMIGNGDFASSLMSRSLENANRFSWQAVSRPLGKFCFS